MCIHALFPTNCMWTREREKEIISSCLFKPTVRLYHFHANKHQTAWNTERLEQKNEREIWHIMKTARHVCEIQKPKNDRQRRMRCWSAAELMTINSFFLCVFLCLCFVCSFIDRMPNPNRIDISMPGRKRAIAHTHDYDNMRWCKIEILLNRSDAVK